MGVMTKENIRAAVVDCEDVTVEHADDKGIEVWDDRAKAKPLQWLVASVQWLAVGESWALIYSFHYFVEE